MLSQTNALDVAPSSRVPALPRVDLYGGVHRGLRLGHTKLLTLLGTTSYTDRTSVERALDELEAFLDLAGLHLAIEERHYHPALEARLKQGAAVLDDQHRAHQRSFAELRKLAAKLSAATTETAPVLGRALYLRYASFVADDLAHMAEEELVILPLFHALYTDDELTAIQTKLVSEIPPREKLEFFRLMLPASNHEQRVIQLAGLKKSLPEPVFQSMVRALYEVLPENDVTTLLAAI
jgi:hemerythrin-like domain-containing protein